MSIHCQKGRARACAAGTFAAAKGNSAPLACWVGRPCRFPICAAISKYVAPSRSMPAPQRRSIRLGSLRRRCRARSDRILGNCLVGVTTSGKSRCVRARSIPQLQGLRGCARGDLPRRPRAGFSALRPLMRVRQSPARDQGFSSDPQRPLCRAMAGTPRTLRNPILKAPPCSTTCAAGVCRRYLSRRAISRFNRTAVSRQ